MARAWVRRAMIGVAVLILGIQLVPYGRDHTNPPVRKEPAWDTAQTRELAVRACFDCHSNQTVWPWYAHIAPVSWLVQRDVDVGRRTVNYSEWDRPQEEAAESADGSEGDDAAVVLPVGAALCGRASGADSRTRSHVRAGMMRGRQGEEGDAERRQAGLKASLGRRTRGA